LLARAARLYGFRAWASTFAENASATRDVIRSAARDALPEPGSEPITVVLLSYRRPWNTPLQVHLCLAAPGVERVIVSHNDPSRPPPPLPDDPRVKLRVQPRESGPITRYQVLRDEPGPWFLALDDDLFLSPAQMARLMRELVRRPEVPHGMCGQLYRAGTFQDNVTRAEGEVDLLNRVYAFTAEHRDRYFELLKSLGIREEAELRRLDDDLVLAFAGRARPRLHDLGPTLDCPSEARRGALWRRRDALPRRLELWARLGQIEPRTGPSPDTLGRERVPGSRWLWAATPGLLLERLRGA
jgi:hypothetical protein